MQRIPPPINRWYRDSSLGEEAKYSSNFLSYLEKKKFSDSSKQDLQMTIFQALESDYKLAGSFPKSFLVSLYETPKNRTVARLALDKKILETMKKICIFDPPKDKYYIPTTIDKAGKIWQHFELAEPQLPVMLFAHLCLPWRSEHIKSLDRDSFLQTNAHDEVVAIQVTTDKNQNSDFYIEREFIDYAFNFEDEYGVPYNVMGLLRETVRKFSRPSGRNKK